MDRLKITVREVNEEDLKSRNLDKKMTGVVITEISNQPLQIF